MSDTGEDDLGWLSDAEDDGSAAIQDDDQDALGWLQDEQDEEGEANTIRADAPDTAGLDWLGDDGDDGGAALLEDEEESEGAGASIFSSALDDFFEGIQEKPTEDDESMKTVVKRAGRISGATKPGQDPRIARVLNTLIKYLTRKEGVKESQLDTIYRLTVGRIVDPISAEVMVIYKLQEDGGTSFEDIFYSKALFKNHPGLEARFHQGLKALGEAKLNKGEGVVGKAIEGRKSLTSLDAKSDPDFKNLLGDATGYPVRTMLTVPIMDGEEVYGALQVMNKDPHCGEEFFSYQDLKLLEQIGGYLGRLIHLVHDPELERNDEEIAGYYATMAGTEVFDPTSDEVYWDDRLFEVVGSEHVQRYEILPLKKIDSKTLQVVMANPMDISRRQNFETATELHIGEVLVAVPAKIQQVLAARFGGKKVDDGATNAALEGLNEFEERTEQVEISAEDDENAGPIVKFTNRIIEDAYARGASDIHIEPYETFARVRYRTDGALQEYMRFPIKALSNIVARIKIMSDLDIAEKRLPQDGKIKYKRYNNRGIDIDLRVATGPMAFGEKVVMRILAKGSISLGLDAMGFSEQNLSKYRWACKQPYGMILNVGPTGSGKTTTLYSGLSEVNDVSVNIQTAEDPIEYPLDGINQMQMLKQIGLDFARALRCYMRMDPDIILVGEIRDTETAEIAIEASLTGHLLFSTLHTNDAAGTVTRFTEMGIEPFMISSSLLVCCAQRLLRRVCDKCRVEWEPDEKELEILMRDPRPIEQAMYRANPTPKGEKPCGKCNGVGYKGRVGTHEVLSLNDELRGLINQNSSSNILKAAAIKAGMKTIFQDSLYKVKLGITDLPDVVARVKADEVEGQRQDDVE